MTDTDDVVQAFYGRWASLYDRIATLPPAATWRDRTAASLGLDAGDTVVEMGCGTGANLPFLRERVGAGGRVVGLDLTRGMLLRARECGREPAALLQADAARPPLAGRNGDSNADSDADGDATGDADGNVGASGTVDALLGTFVVAMFDDPAAVVDDWCDLVAPGGRVGLLHFHASDRRWAPPANAVYRALVRSSSPNALRASGAAASHDARVREAHDALAERATDVEERAFAGGFVRLVVGRLSGN